MGTAVVCSWPARLTTCYPWMTRGFLTRPIRSRAVGCVLIRRRKARQEGLVKAVMGRGKFGLVILGGSPRSCETVGVTCESIRVTSTPLPGLDQPEVDELFGRAAGQPGSPWRAQRTARVAPGEQAAGPPWTSPAEARHYLDIKGGIMYLSTTVLQPQAVFPSGKWGCRK